MILVTGGTGMLGSHLLFKLVQGGESLRATKRKSSNMDQVRKIFSFYCSNPDELFSRIEWVDSDILNTESLNEVISGIEKVYHAAAMVSFNPADKYKMINNNVKGTANVVNACLLANVKKLCHVSSVSALGHADSNALTDEETFRNPKGYYSGYSISKFRSELEVWRGITEGLNAVIVNPSIILGPGDWRSGSPGIFSNIHKGIKFYTKGITGYVDVWDVVKSMMELMNSNIQSERFIVSCDNVSYREMFSMVADALKVKKPSVYANSFLLGMAWRFDSVRSKLAGDIPFITKEMVYSAKRTTLFSSKKLIDELNFKYTPVQESIIKIADIFEKHELNNGVSK